MLLNIICFEAIFLFNWCHQCHPINWHCIFFLQRISHFIQNYIRLQKIKWASRCLDHGCAEYNKWPEPLKATRFRKTSICHTNAITLPWSVTQGGQTPSVPLPPTLPQGCDSCHTSVKAPVWITHQAKAIKTQHPPSQSHRLGISVMIGSWHLKREGDLTLGFVPPNPRLIAL